MCHRKSVVKAATASDVSFRELPTLLTALETATVDSYPRYSKLVCIPVPRRFRCGIGRLSHFSFLVSYYYISSFLFVADKSICDWRHIAADHAPRHMRLRLRWIESPGLIAVTVGSENEQLSSEAISIIPHSNHNFHRLARPISNRR